MAATTAIILCMIFLIFGQASCQHLGLQSSSHSGICPSMYCNSVVSLKRLQDCVVVLGNLRVLLMEKTNASAFQNIRFPKLREVTGFMAVYRVRGLESLGHLFPNLTRIRGSQLINNYGLIVHDMPSLKEVGLYSLLKIDRGGVIIWGGSHTCYIESIDWNAIAPRSRHMLTYPEMTAHCNSSKLCKNCSNNESNKYCWNSKKCQRFISGPKAEECNAECLGCRGGRDVCTACRHYTHQGRCVSLCPADTIVLPENQYCIAREECAMFNRWIWKGNCVSECPVDYTKRDENGTTTCERCYECQKVCPSLLIDSLSGIQQASRCVLINGSLTIHVRSVPGVVDELNKHLSLIEEVNDYVLIYGSVTIKSLSFLQSLKHIAGSKLKHDTYSLIIHDMKNLEELFTPQVMEQLTVSSGRMQLYNNPYLCLSKLNEFKEKFPVKSNSTDIPPALNGYSGGCVDNINLKVTVLNDTAVHVTFSPNKNPNIQYTLLYTKIALRTHATLVPETCSESEWFAIDTEQGKVLLTSLRPASTYAVCIEAYTHLYKPLENYLARTTIVNFTTSFTKPEPPFIQEIVALSSQEVILSWIDHIDYRRYITYYQLDVILVEIPDNDLRARDHCNNDIIYDTSEDYNRHAVVLKPPIDYDACGLQCFTITTVLNISLEDHFDVCNSINSECNYYEDDRPKNSSFGNYVRTLTLDIERQNIFKVDGLAPYRDYRFRLRACAKDNCSRSSRRIVRTLRSHKADVPTITHYGLNNSGHIFVKWKPPDITNGPVLIYNVHFLSFVAKAKKNGAIPDSVCVYPEHLNLIVRLKPAQNYYVRVCSMTLGSLSACTEWKNISVPKEYDVLLVGFSFSITLAIVSAVIGFIYNKNYRVINSDTIPLVHITSVYRSESDPPSVVVLSDLMPLYSAVSFRDALLKE